MQRIDKANGRLRRLRHGRRMRRFALRGRRPWLLFAAAGVTDAASFTAFYWSEQFATPDNPRPDPRSAGSSARAYGMFKPKPIASARGRGPRCLPGLRRAGPDREERECQNGWVVPDDVGRESGSRLGHRLLVGGLGRRLGRGLGGRLGGAPWRPASCRLGAAVFFGAALARRPWPPPSRRSPWPVRPRSRSARRRPWRRRPRHGPSCSTPRGPCRRRSGRPWPWRPCRPRCGPWRPSCGGLAGRLDGASPVWTCAAEGGVDLAGQARLAARGRVRVDGTGLGRAIERAQGLGEGRPTWWPRPARRHGQGLRDIGLRGAPARAAGSRGAARPTDALETRLRTVRRSRCGASSPKG